MEAFSLLRYWRSNAGDATSNADVRTSTATTIVTAVSSQTSETEDEEDEEDDHGPFFDLEFSLPAEGGEDELVKNGETENSIGYGEEDEDEDEEEDSDGSDELKFTLLSGSSGDSTADVNVSVSPSDDLFFKGGFVPVDQTVEINSKPLQSRVSLMKSATKFRVMMLKLKKSNSKSNAESSETTESNASSSSNSKEEQKNDEKTEKADRNGESEDSGKLPAVKLEDVPTVSLFKRHNSSKAPKKKQNENESVSASSEEKKFSKEAMQRYLRKVKPLYIRVSKRYAEKLKFTGQASSPAREAQKQSPAINPMREKESISEVSEPPLLPSNVKALKQGNLPTGLRVVCKHLRKSQSAFTAVAAAPPGAISSKRRDDSLIQQQDGIQSAILHCKRSFKASRDSDCSSSDPAAVSGNCKNSSFSDATEEEINKKRENENDTDFRC
ncbi:hypothetical protein L1987_09726 [Smallanthus sonchifolius]|uniref:Uncharacterized protein n=1 Tax=Smallanthus sonchifolius TaxID=185202 RepID=A0ACB9JQ46_9ASTR|nr:hypothetical protein L1987_09726 [Smallanthus sonchifolius]